MVRALTLSILVALVATAEAGVCKVKKPRPSAANNATSSLRTITASAYPDASASVSGVASSVVASVTVPSAAASSDAAGAEPTPSDIVATAPSEIPAAPSNIEGNNLAAAAQPTNTAASNDGRESWLPRDTANTAYITHSSTGDDIAGNSAISKWVLGYHNQFRAQFSASPLTWDAGFAQESAKNTGACADKHAGFDNLSWWWGSQTPINIHANQMLDGWAKEWPDSFGADGKANTLNHFTMMVWKDVTAVGCAWSTECGSNDGSNEVYFVCTYTHNGNIVGEEATQVGAFTGTQ